MAKKELKKILKASRFPIILLAAMWLVKIIEVINQTNFVDYGLMPRDVRGLTGIVTSVFIHGDWNHIINNSWPLFILGWTIFFFYKEVAWKIIFWVVLMGGFWTWISAREAHHIGASGLLYGMFSFVLFSGFIRRNKQLLSISFLVAFLYGSLVWGLLPIDYKMSWESHFWGFMAGFALAVYYRKIGKQREKHVWNEEEEALLEEMDYWKSDKNQNQPQGYRIIYKEADKSAKPE